MKKFFIAAVFMSVLAACNNGSKSTESVGDSMKQEPISGQPITTEPDTVGPDAADTTHQNQQH